MVIKKQEYNEQAAPFIGDGPFVDVMIETKCGKPFRDVIPRSDIPMFDEEHAISIGPSFSELDEDGSKATRKKRPFPRPLVFDFDLNDSTKIRHVCGCGNDLRVCYQCLCYASWIVEVIRCVLEPFGVEPVDVKPFFSGRRGIHVWCMGQAARGLTAPVIERVLCLVSNGNTTIISMTSAKIEEVVEKCKTWCSKSGNPRHLTRQDILEIPIKPDKPVTLQSKTHMIRCPYSFNINGEQRVVPLSKKLKELE